MLFVVVSCAAAPPAKNYKVTEWLPTINSCFERLLPDDTIETICISNNSTMIGVSLQDLQKERNYQDLLIRKCKKWSK